MSIMDRMKMYEKASRMVLPPRMPVIMRIDGKTFHMYTKGCNKPFDTRLMSAMNNCALVLCSEIQGAQLAYVQSDEISILIHSYKTFDSQAWFSNQVQKMTSVGAAIASAVMTSESTKIFNRTKLAYFDARVFVLPEADVCNYFIARQQDWTRNSVQMMARSMYSDKECHKKNNSQLQEMIWQKGKNWNDLDTCLKRGRCVVKGNYTVEVNNEKFQRSQWFVDGEIPIFTQDREYIEKHLEREM